MPQENSTDELRRLAAEHAGMTPESWIMDWAADEIDRLRLMLQMAYCQKIGSDSPQGLDCCDDYLDWIKTLTPNGQG